MPRQLAPKSGGSQIVPVFTLFRVRQGEYLLRTFTAGDTFLATELAKALADKRLLTVVTPTDTKVFTFSDSGIGDETDGDGVPDYPQPPSPSGDDHEISDPMEEAGRLAEEADKVTEIAAVPKKRSHHKKREEAVPNSVCGRCRGRGMVAQLMEGGQPTEGTCPVCKGTGEIIRYGGGRK